jgi:hypothetical protein
MLAGPWASNLSSISSARLVTQSEIHETNDEEQDDGDGTIVDEGGDDDDTQESHHEVFASNIEADVEVEPESANTSTENVDQYDTNVPVAEEADADEDHDEESVILGQRKRHSAHAIRYENPKRIRHRMLLDYYAARKTFMLSELTIYTRNICVGVMKKLSIEYSNISYKCN